MGFFKSKEEKAALKFEKGADLISQGKFDDARKNLQKSVDKGNASPDVHILIAMLDLRPNFGSTDSLRRAIAVFSKYDNVTVEYGVHEVNSTKLLNECKLYVDANEAMSVADGAKNKVTQAMGEKLIQCGNAFDPIGDEALLMEEIFDGKKITGRNYALFLKAKGYEVMAQAVKWDDSRKAADYAQQAASLRRDRGDDADAARDQKFVENASKTAHCWFCDKEVSGMDIHFVEMDSFITKPIQAEIDKSDSQIKSSGKDVIYACRACYSAINIQDEMYLSIAKKYADEELRKVRNELIGHINDLQRQINELARNSHYHS